MIFHISEPGTWPHKCENHIFCSIDLSFLFMCLHCFSRTCIVCHGFAWTCLELEQSLGVLGLRCRQPVAACGSPKKAVGHWQPKARWVQDPAGITGKGPMQTNSVTYISNDIHNKPEWEIPCWDYPFEWSALAAWILNIMWQIRGCRYMQNLATIWDLYVFWSTNCGFWIPGKLGGLVATQSKPWVPNIHSRSQSWQAAWMAWWLDRGLPTSPDLVPSPRCKANKNMKMIWNQF